MKPFLTAEWKNLVVLNYEVDPSILAPLVPIGTELDLWEGRALVSLVAFQFLQTKVRGVAIPGHVNFEEVNLRFYVRNGARRGVVFVREFVPRWAISWVARTIYGEPYATLPMSHDVSEKRLEYRWGQNRVMAHREGPASALVPGSEAEFTLEHYWGYTRRTPTRTLEYQVTHPRWRVWTDVEVDLDVDFEACYGKECAGALAAPYRSAMVADGSEVKVYPGARLS